MGNSVASYGLGMSCLADRFCGQPLPMTTEKQPHVTEENHRAAERVMKSYDDTRPTVVLPGSGGTVSGTAVNDWIDDEGKPIYGRADEGKDQGEGKDDAKDEDKDQDG